MTSETNEYAFIGGLRQDYCITHDGRVFVNAMGGNALYAAVGARLWHPTVRLVSRVGSDFPQEWLEELEGRGFDTSGVHVLGEPLDTRTFYAYLSQEERVDTNPASHFLRIGQPLPKELLGYRSSTAEQENRSVFGPLAVRPDDLEPSLASIQGAHFAPADYLTHTTVQFQLREFGVPLITLDPSVRYMDASFQEELPVMLSGLDAFLPSESECRTFFRPAKLDNWEMAEAFGSMGARFVVIKCGARGQMLWDHDARERWRIPAYPARVRDVTGAGDAFCGGFLVGLSMSGDPIRAALQGSVSASLVIEGSGALYALAALPELVNARYDALRGAIRKA
jgi:ribokinase